MSLSNQDRDEVRRQFLRFKQGSSQAFRYFFDLHHRSLFLVIKGSVGDTETTKDIIAEAFKQLFNNREQINDPDHLRRYVYCVARNETIDRYRKGQTSDRGLGDYARQAETVYTDPRESEMIHAKTMEGIAKGVAKLPARRRLIFLRHYFIGEDTRTIANDLKISEQTVRNQLTRARDSLRKSLWKSFE